MWCLLNYKNIRDKMFYFILYLYNKDLSMKLGRPRRGKFFYPFRKDHIFPLPCVASKNDKLEWLWFGSQIGSP